MLRQSKIAVLNRIVVLAACALISLAATAAPPKYKLTRIGRIGGPSAIGQEINSVGYVMGYLNVDDVAHTFLYKNGIVIDITPQSGDNVLGIALNNSGDITGHTIAGNPGSVRAFAFIDGQFIELSSNEFEAVDASDINSKGQIAGEGYVRPASGSTRAFLYDNGDITLLPLEAFVEHAGVAINSHGEIAGYGQTTEGERHAFLYRNGMTIDLGTLGGDDSYGSDINGAGQVAGFARTIDGHHRAFRYSDGTMLDLGTLGGSQSFGWYINNAGQVAGEAQTSTFHIHPFFHDGVTMIDLGLPDGVTATTMDITNNGQVCGIQFKEDGTSIPFIYGVDGTFTHDLNDLIDNADPLRPFVQLSQAMSVNALGQIVANGTDSRNGQVHGYVVSPIDSTKPVIKSILTGIKGTNGWYTSDVRIKWSVTDAQAPIAKKVGCVASTVSSDTNGQKSSCKATSIGGTANKAVTIKRDTTLPTVSIGNPAAGAVFNRNQVVVASYDCADAPSGISICSGTVANGQQIDTSKKVINAVFRVLAKDKAGIGRVVTRTYSVK